MISFFVIWEVASFKMYLINNVLSLLSLYNFGRSVKVVDKGRLLRKTSCNKSPYSRTGLTTKDETLETTLRHLYCLFHLFMVPSNCLFLCQIHKLAIKQL